MEAAFQVKLEYCFTKEKEIVFAQQKQSIPMSIYIVKTRNRPPCW